MKKLLANAIAAITITAQAEPEVRRAIHVNQGVPAMPAEPQIRRAIPVNAEVVAAEMRDASEATFTRQEEDETPQSAVPTATTELASDIDYSRENAEAENSPYRRLVKAAASECVERHGKQLALGRLKGTMDICIEYYDASVEEEEADMGTSWSETIDSFYEAVLAHLSRGGKIPTVAYEKEAARMAAKWSR